jgi:hypothetical protein
VERRAKRSQSFLKGNGSRLKLQKHSQTVYSQQNYELSYSLFLEAAMIIHAVRLVLVLSRHMAGKQNNDG